MLCNIDHISMGGMTTINPEALANSIADIYLADVLGPAEAAGQTIPPPTAVKLSDAELSEKTGLYRVVASDLPALLSVDHGTLMLRSYYQDDFDFELTPVAATGSSFKAGFRSSSFQPRPAAEGVALGRREEPARDAAGVVRAALRPRSDRTPALTEATNSA